MNQPIVSVIICTYNRDEYLGKCLDSLANQTADNSSYEVVVVNNNSSDNTDSICRGFLERNPETNIQYHIEKQQGLSYARNRGIDESKGKYLIYLDDDAFAAEGYVEAVINFTKSHPDAVAFGGQTLPVFETKKPRWLSVFLMPMLAVTMLGDKAKKFPGKKFPIGANMGFSREIIEKVGNFNPHLGRVGKNLASGEEKDIFDRIRKLKKPIWYIPKALVHHVIPDKRLEKDFVKRQAKSIGRSERQRTKMVSDGAYNQRLSQELIKWCATFVLGFFYLITLQPSKTVMLFRFRYWVSLGLFGKGFDE